MSKGSKRRPMAISQKEFKRRWNKAFGTNKENPMKRRNGFDDPDDWGWDEDNDEDEEEDDDEL